MDKEQINALVRQINSIGWRATLHYE